MSFISRNIGTVAVGAALLAAVALIIRGIIRDKKAGKSLCGGDCAHCGACCRRGGNMRHRKA